MNAITSVENGYKNSTLSAASNGSDTDGSINFWLVFVDKCEGRFGHVYCNYAALMVFIGFVLQMMVMPLVISRIRDLGPRFRNQYNLSFVWLCSIVLSIYIDLIEYVFSYDGHIQTKMITFVNCVFFVLAIWMLFEYWRFYDVEGMNNSWTHFISTLFSLCLAVLIGIARVWAYKHTDESSDEKLANKAIKSYTFLYFWVYAIFGFTQIHSNIRNNFSRCFTQWGYSLWLVGSYMLTYYTVLLVKNKPKYDYIYYKNYFQVTTLIYIVLQEVITKQVKARNQQILKRVYEQGNIQMKEKNSRLDRGESVDVELQMTAPNDHNSNQYESFRFSETGQKRFDQSSAPPIPSDKDGVDICFDAQQYEQGNVQNNLNVYDYDQNNFESSQNLTAGGARLYGRSGRLERLDEFLNKNANFLLCVLIAILTLQLFFSAFILLKAVTSSLLALVSILVHPAAFLVGYLFKNYSFMIFK